MCWEAEKHLCTLIPANLILLILLFTIQFQNVSWRFTLHMLKKKKKRKLDSVCQYDMLCALMVSSFPGQRQLCCSPGPTGPKYAAKSGLQK